jgi:GT2 family glycosyltransferase
MISIVLPVLNNYSMTMACLRNIAETTRGEYEVILVNDGSIDETRDIRQSSPVDRLRVIHHGRNQGFASACNTGISLARGKAIAIWHNDYIVSRNWDVTMEAMLFAGQVIRLKGEYQAKAGMVSAREIHPIGRGAGPYHMSYIDYFDQFMSKPRLAMYNEPDLMLWQKGCPMLFKRETLEKVGLFDVRFNMGPYLDIDMFIRMAMAGYAFGDIGNTFCYHYCHITSDTEYSLLGGSNGISMLNEPLFWYKYGLSLEDVDLTDIFINKRFGKIAA